MPFRPFRITRRETTRAAAVRLVHNRLVPPRWCPASIMREGTGKSRRPKIGHFKVVESLGHIDPKESEDGL
jgi:hypothetical protein